MRYLLGLGAVLIVLAGCGQKGPLYPPDDEQAAEQYDPAEEHDASGADGIRKTNDTTTASGDED